MLAMPAMVLVVLLLATSAAHGDEAGPLLPNLLRSGAPQPTSRRVVQDEVVEESEAENSTVRFATLQTAVTAYAVPDKAAEPAAAPLGEAVIPGAADAMALAESGGEPCVAGCGHELWIVSTRGLADAECGCELPPFTPCVERYICGSGWVVSSLEDLVADQGGTQSTAVFVHGNDTDADEAKALGKRLYDQLLATRCPVPATRLVVWSWPSERVLRRRRPDVQVKACRTNVEGYYLAQFLDQLPGETHASLGGFSYGARVVTGGLHLLGGGTLAGRQLADHQHPDRRATSTILLGAAMNNDWLLPGRRHERALSQVDRMVILTNPADGVLHFYPYLWGRGGTEALGVTGIPGAGRLGPDVAKVEQINVRPELHCRHGWQYYTGSPTVMSLVRRELVYLPAAGTVEK